MKVTFDTAVLSAHIKSFKPNNKCIDILTSIKMDVENGVVYFTTTDLDVFVESETRCTSDGDGVICLPYAEVSVFLKNSKATQFTIDAPVRVFTGEKDEKGEAISILPPAIINGVFSIRQNDDDFPIHPEWTALRSMLFSGALLHEMKAAGKYVGKDELRPVMSGVCITNKYAMYDVFSTDAHKLFQSSLGMRTEDDKEDFELIVKYAPVITATAAAFKQMNEDVVVSWDNRYIQMRGTGWCVTSRLEDGRYPNVPAAIPKDNPIHITIDVAALNNAIKQVIPANTTTSRVEFTFNKYEAILECSDEDLGTSMKATIPCTYNEEEPFRIGFHGKLMLSILESVLESSVTLEMSAPNRAAVMHSKHRLMLLMPVILNN